MNNKTVNKLKYNLALETRVIQLKDCYPIGSSLQLNCGFRCFCFKIEKAIRIKGGYTYELS